MKGRYTVDDLLKLRASSLVTKPSNLGAIQETISTGDAKSVRPTTRAKPDDTAQSETFQKRPLLDGQSRKSITGMDADECYTIATDSSLDPDRIVLGPPKRSFASSNTRTNERSLPDGEDLAIRKERLGAVDRVKNGDDRRSHPVNGRFSTRHELDGDEDERHSRREDVEDDSRSRRDGRQKRTTDDNDTMDTRDTRRDQNTRGKFDQPWFRKSDRGPDSNDDNRRDGNRRSDWRQDQGKGRGWDNHAEADPEWMDAPEEEPQQTPARTQEDFQRWKERMKAGKNPVDSTSVPQTPTSPPPPSATAHRAPRTTVNLEADDSMDKFLARFSESKPAPEQAVTTKPTSKTRFASLFGPPPPQAREEPPPQPVVDLPLRHKTTSPPSVGVPGATADQAGFARILEMLQGRSNDTTPQGSDPHGHTAVYARDPQSMIDSRKPELMNLLNQTSSVGIRPPPEQPPIQTSYRADTQSPLDHGHARQQSNKDETLLTLLKQASQAPKPTPVHHAHEQYAMRGMFADDNTNRMAMQRNRMISPDQLAEQAFLQRREDRRQPLEENIQRYQEGPSHYEHLSRRPTNEGRRQDEDQLLSLLRQQKMSQQGPPPGFGRPPPGIESAPGPSPGWPQQALPSNQQPQPQPSRPGPPLGMQQMPRNMPSGFLPPGMLQQRPPQQPPPPRKYTGDSFPLTMAPPPGFLNNGAPPGFPGGGPNNMARFAGPPQPSPMDRHYLGMYEDAARQGIRGAGATGHR